MDVLLGIAVVLAGAAFLRRRASAARSDPWAGPRTGGQRGRAQAGLQARGGRPRSLGADLRHMRAAAALEDWREHRSHERTVAAKNGGYTPPAPPEPPSQRRFGRSRRGGTTATAVPRVIPGAAQPVTPNGSGPQPGAAPVQPPGQKWRPWAQQPPTGSGPVPSPPNGGNGQTAPNGNGQTASKPPQPAPSAPPRPSPSPSPSGGNSTMAGAGTSTASAEKLIEGINEIHAHAAAGGIHAKQEAIKAAHEGAVRFSAMLAMLSRTMSEPGSNYGREITEPLAQGSQNLQATAMSISEADAALSSLLNMNVGDLANSPRQAPHHSELTETGAH